MVTRLMEARIIRSIAPSSRPNGELSLSRAMNPRIIAGSSLSYLYSSVVGKCPFHWLRRCYLKLYLARMQVGTSVQMGCRFLNGRKVFLGERNIINFGCLFDGRKFAI